MWIPVALVCKCFKGNLDPFEQEEDGGGSKQPPTFLLPVNSTLGCNVKGREDALGAFFQLLFREQVHKGYDGIYPSPISHV